MQLSNLKPTGKKRVYDLVHEAGLDVSDWANYKLPERPDVNPKYCYEWVFTGEDRIVLSFWMEDMKQDSSGIYQEHNYRSVDPLTRGWNPAQIKRAKKVEDALQFAFDRDLPAHVMINERHASKPGQSGPSKVKYRTLDTTIWHVENCDANGKWRIRRGSATRATSEGSDKKLARIAYNSNEWRSPSGDAGGQEAESTHNSQNNFGHEEWLFRNEWQIDGWRYAFIEGFNTKKQTYAGKELDVSLYTIEEDKRCRFVGTINEVEGLTESQAEAAVKAFKANGWFDSMKAEVEAIGGNADALDKTDWAPHILNVRFRADNVDLYPADTYLDNNKWLKDRHRYILYNFGQATQDAVERGAAKRKGSHDAPTTGRFFRKGTKPLEYTPEHQIIAKKLVNELREDYPKECITCEQDFVDVRVETDAEVIYFEIKTDLNTKAVIRQALGQLLEYAYHPARDGRQPDQLVIVGRSALTGADAEYLLYLSNELKLPLSYRQVEVSEIKH